MEFRHHRSRRKLTRSLERSDDSAASIALPPLPKARTRRSCLRRRRPTQDNYREHGHAAAADPPPRARPATGRRVAFSAEVTVKVVRPVEGTIACRTEAHWVEAAAKRARRNRPARQDLTAREMLGVGNSDGLHSCARTRTRPRGLSDAQIVKLDWLQLSFGPGREALVAPETLDVIRMELARAGIKSLAEASPALRASFYEECLQHEGRRGLRSWGGPRAL